MIVDRIQQDWAEAAGKRRPGGTPTGSQWGACIAKLQMQVFPTLTHPEPFQPRSIGVFEVGDLFHEFLAAKIAKAYPGVWGLREQSFYLPVQIPERFELPGHPEVVFDRAAIVATVKSRLRPERPVKGGPREAWVRTPFWGWPIPDFDPPRVKLNGVDARGRPKLQIGGGVGDPDPADEARFAPSIVLDEAAGLIYVRTDVDGLVATEHGLTLVENKSMSTAAFRRAVVGDLDYRYRQQLVGTMKAVGVEAAAWVLARKDTSHLAEVVFAPVEGGTRVTLLAPGGQRDSFVVEDRARRTLRRDAPPQPPEGPQPALPLMPDPAPASRPFPEDNEWDVAQVAIPWSPNDAEALAEVERTVLASLLAQPGRWYRQYGPDFRCPKCAGQKVIVCARCRGTGTAVKTGQPCGACGPKGKNQVGTPGWLNCATTLHGCGGVGLLESVNLPWECRYCPVVMTCWEPAGVERTIEGGRPIFRVSRKAYEASGLTFYPPMPIQVEPEDGEEEDEEEAGA